MTDRENADKGDEMDMLFRKSNFAAEDRGFRERLRAKLHKRMEEMEREERMASESQVLDLDEEALAQAAGGLNANGAAMPPMQNFGCRRR
ncbi:MAG: hypothetical protein J6N22_06085 [Schwartzia sp.]|nr:hypothetical protein [Schwartzia sp. (in: firmicutes)]